MQTAVAAELHLQPVPADYLGRVAVLYGTSELHPARDSCSFTTQLCGAARVARGGTARLLDLPARVNQAWQQIGIRQRCKLDCVEIGENWRGFYWPAPLQQSTVRRLSNRWESFDREQEQKKEVASGKKVGRGENLPGPTKLSKADQALRQSAPAVMRPLVVSLGEVTARQEDSLSLGTGQVFQSLGGSRPGGWVKGKVGDTEGWYQVRGCYE